MGTALTGNTISSSYLGLIKTTDSAAISSSAKRLTDGAGNDSPLYLSTSRLGIGITPTSTLHVSGDFTLTGAFKDSSGDTGSAGQILSSTGSGTNWIANDVGDITSVVAGDGLTGGGTSGDVTLNVGAGNLIDVQADQIDVDLSELTTSTSDADGDFFAVIDNADAQKKLTKGNINLSGFNNDIVSGSTNKIAKFTSTTAVGDSVITEVSSEIGINTASPEEMLHQHINAVSNNYHKFTNVSGDLLVGINTAGEGQITNSLNASNGRIRLTTYSGEWLLTLAGDTEQDNSKNLDQYYRISNANTGTAAEATIYVTNSTTQADGLFLGVAGTSFTTASGFVQDGAHIGSGTGASGGLSIMTRAAADMRFYTNGHTNERMRILSAGNVGIGEIAPEGKLHIKSADSGATTVGGASDELILENDTDCGVTIRSGITSDGVISFADSGDHNIGQIYYSHSNDSMSFKTNDSIAATITSGGNVGIGTTSPNPFSWGNKHLTIEAAGTNQYAALDLVGSGNGAGAIIFGGGSGSGTATNIGRALISALDGSHLAFYTNASNSGASFTERMRIDSSGDTTFTGKITANTGSKITSSSADTTFSIETTSGSTIFPVLDFVSSHSSAGARIRVGGTDVISLDKSQNATFAGIVGINGSTTANVPLTATTSSGYEDVAYFKSAGTNIDSRINLIPTGTGDGAINATANDLLFQIAGTTAGVFKGKALGVGHNTADNSATGGIHIEAASSTDQLILEATGSGTAKWYLGARSNSLYFVDVVAASTRMLIDSNGDITGYGAITATGNLNASGTDSTFNTGNSGTFEMSDTSSYPRITLSGASAQLGLFRSGSSVGGAYIGGDSGGFKVRHSDFSTTFHVDTAGNTMPGQYLWVNTTATIDSEWLAVKNTTSGTYACIGAWNTATSGTVEMINFYTEASATARGQIVYSNTSGDIQIDQLSDVSLKENIKDLDNSLEFIQSLKPRIFDFKDEENGKKGVKNKAGFIAQEVEEVKPEWVNERKGLKSLPNSLSGGVVPYLIKAIQELKAEIDELKKK